ncbi:MAG: PQQ-dependent sugar dehydrogenase [Thermoproteota archaeon]|nr:PQQ-dependent sugar dehydrogenase [Thermoproteota archaeon]
MIENLRIILFAILMLSFLPAEFIYYSAAEPIVNDPNLKAEIVFKGIEFPTNMDFLDSDDILVLEKNNGVVRRIVNGMSLSEPLLDVNVANANERGLLGVAVVKNDENTSNVFLYYTESKERDGKYDDCNTPTNCNKGNDPLGNRLYRYELIHDKLMNPKLLLDLPATPGPAHDGGVITLGPDKNVYLVIGELTLMGTQASNVQKGLAPDGRGGILRVTQDGKVVEGVLGDTNPLNLYYAYGIRNSFGIDFDPLTGNLWDTENGPGNGDEINLVEPGFNSGWSKVQGIWEVKKDSIGNIVLAPDNLVDFDGKGKYSIPKFVWNSTVAPTAAKFLSSDKLGTQYENDLFIGDGNNGNIYHFDLNNDRTELALQGPLVDKVANTISETQDIIWGKGFGIITDIQVGPDGYLYILSINLPQERGTIFRIVPVV